MQKTLSGKGEVEVADLQTTTQRNHETILLFNDLADILAENKSRRPIQDMSGDLAYQWVLETIVDAIRTVVHKSM
jgi:hypothetical protein